MLLINNAKKTDENGYIIIEPIIKIDLDKDEDPKKYTRFYNREYYRKFLSTKVECSLCGCSASKEKLNRHKKTNKCQRLRNQNMEECIHTLNV